MSKGGRIKVALCFPLLLPLSSLSTSDLHGSLMTLPHSYSLLVRYDRGGDGK